MGQEKLSEYQVWFKGAMSCKCICVCGSVCKMDIIEIFRYSLPLQEHLLLP